VNGGGRSPFQTPQERRGFHGLTTSGFSQIASAPLRSAKPDCANHANNWGEQMLKQSTPGAFATDLVDVPVETLKLGEKMRFPEKYESMNANGVPGVHRDDQIVAPSP